MVLLTLLVVGLLSLSSIALRTSGQGEAQAQARSNARLALMLAIGNLQKLAGPDQRLTANAEILQGSGSALPPNDQWVGVWRSDGYKSDKPNTPIITAKADGSGYSDRRAGTPYDARTQALGWLVSGPDSAPLVALSPALSVTARSGPTPVRVPVVALSGPNQHGAFAYHIADESSKIRLTLEDPYAPQQPKSAATQAPAFNRWVAPQTADATVCFPHSNLLAGQAAKLLSNRQVELSSLAAGKAPALTKELVKSLAEDFTVCGRSVLADPVQGGLKRDLTSYLEDNNAPALGKQPAITDTTVITDALAGRARSGPKFGMLRNWYALRGQGSGSGDQRVMDVQTANTTNSSPRIVDPGAAFVKPLIQPVMTEAVYYLRHVIDGNKVVELIYPRVVLWNPFAVRLQTQGYVALFDFRLSHVLRVNVTPPITPTLNLNFNYNLNQHLGFYLPPTVLDPGEALTFCAPSKNTTVNPDNLCANALSASANPGTLGFFRRDWPGGTLDPAVDPATVSISYDTNASIIWNTDQRTQTVSLHAATGSATAAGLLGQTNPAIRQISLDNFSRGNNGRWLPGYTPPHTYRLTDVMSGNIPPDSLLAFGARFRYLYETNANRNQGSANQEPWYYAPLIHHNIAAANIHRWPIDNIFGMEYTAVGSGVQAGPHLYSYGPIAQARQWSEWLDPEVMPHRDAAGKNRTAVFTDASFATGTSTYPVYDIPSPAIPLTSLGTLQHVPLSPFIWHPSHIIGQSFPSPYVPLAAGTTSRSSQAEHQLWTDKLSHLTPGTNPDITAFDSLGSGSSMDVLLNDVSYEVNQALWDRFFLSAIPRSDPAAAWAGEHWDLTKPLPNARLSIDPSLSQAGSKALLLDHYRAASGLWLEGGFNIHSTRVKAWASLLRSFRDVAIPTLTGTGEAGTTAFPGHLIAQGQASSKALNANLDRYWSAYRSLSDAEIDALAAAIVVQVRKRAPFIGVADFINRRLGNPDKLTPKEAAYGGVLQTAINQTKAINGSAPNWLLPTDSSAATDYKYGAPYWGGPIITPEPQEFRSFLQLPGGQPYQKGMDAAALLTQADILQQLGPVLVARGDTFVVRAYGEARDATGKVTAKAWCEAVVQRSPEPVNPDPAAANLNPPSPTDTNNWGRKFNIESFCWLNDTDI